MNFLIDHLKNKYFDYAENQWFQKILSDASLNSDINLDIQMELCKNKSLKIPVIYNNQKKY